MAILAPVSCAPLAGAFGPTEVVTVAFPAPHPALALCGGGAGATWAIRWYGKDGTPHRLSGQAGEASIRVDRGCFTPIVAVPETGGTGIPNGALPAAGGLYPVNAATGSGETRVAVSWLGGIAASCAERACVCAAGGFDAGLYIAEHFNWKRFLATLGAFEQPAAIDADRFAQALLSGRVTAYDVRQRALAGIPVPPPARMVPAGTVFMPAWPGGAVFAWPESGTPVLRLPDGLARFFSEAGTLSVQVAGGKPLCAFFEPYVLQDRGASGTVVVP